MTRRLVPLFALLLAACADAGPAKTPTAVPAVPALAGNWDVETGGAPALLVLTQKGSELTGYWQTEVQTQPLEGSIAADGGFTLRGRALDTSLTVTGKLEGSILALTLNRGVAGSRLKNESKATAKRRPAPAR